MKLKRYLQSNCIIAVLCFSTISTYIAGTSYAQPLSTIQRLQILDGEEVESAIKNITVQSLSQLKIGYFGRRIEGKLPFSSALQLLADTIAKETVGSKRWFLLQNLQAAAAFQTGVIAKDKGFESYDAIFRAASSVNETDSLYALRLSIAEYVGFANGRFRGMGLQNDQQVRITLLNAWDAYVLSTAHPSKGYAPEIDFIGAFRSTGSSQEAQNRIETSLVNPEIKRTYSLLFTAAALSVNSNPTKAQLYLDEAEPLLPQRPLQRGKSILTQLDTNIAARYYDLYVDLLNSSKRTDEAIAKQSKRVERLNGGRGKLWLMLQRAGRRADADVIYSTLKTEAMSELEVIRAVREWRDIKPIETQLYSVSILAVKDLLESYLSSNRSRTMEYELEARMFLGTIYLKTDDLKKAESIVSITKPSVLPKRLQYLWMGIEKIQNTVKERNLRLPVIEKKL